MGQVSIAPSRRNATARMDEEELRDPEYWKRMRDDFLRVDPGRHLVLNWSYFPSTGGYFFRLHFKDEHQSIESDFSALAARAGRITTKYPNPTQGWFHLIATYKGLNVEKLQMKDPQTGMVKACLNGQTDRLSEISAVLCSRYEKQMVEEISIRNYARKLTPTKPLGDKDPVTARRGYRAEVHAWMKSKKGLRTNADAAKALAVSVDVLKSIMSSNGKLRCSKETLDRVIAIINPTHQ